MKLRYNDVIDRAEFLAKGGAFTVRRIGDYADWDFDLLKKAADNCGNQRLEVPGIRKALIQAAAEAQDRAHRKASRPQPPRTPSQAPAARPAGSSSGRVDVRLALALEDVNGNLLHLADGRQPQLVKQWTLKWIPAVGDKLILLSVNGKPVRLNVLLSTDDGVLPRVGGAVSIIWWAELQARGFTFLTSTD